MNCSMLHSGPVGFETIQTSRVVASERRDARRLNAIADHRAVGFAAGNAAMRLREATLESRLECLGMAVVVQAC